MLDELKAPARWMVAIAFIMGILSADVFTSPFRRHFPPVPIEIAWNAGILLCALLVRRSALPVALGAPIAVGAILWTMPLGWQYGSLVVGLVTSFMIATFSFLPFMGMLRERRSEDVRMSARLWVSVTAVVVLLVPSVLAVMLGRTGQGGNVAAASSLIAFPLAVPVLVGWAVSIAADLLWSRIRVIRDVRTPTLRSDGGATPD